jgi:hypothetical protein
MFLYAAGGCSDRIRRRTREAQIRLKRQSVRIMTAVSPGQTHPGLVTVRGALFVLHHCKHLLPLLEEEKQPRAGRCRCERQAASVDRWLNPGPLVKAVIDANCFINAVNPSSDSYPYFLATTETKQEDNGMTPSCLRGRSISRVR